MNKVRFQPFEDIISFHRKFDLSPATTMSQEDFTNLQDFRVKFMLEELSEYLNATTEEEAFDGLIDLVYVALGTAYMRNFLTFNFNWNVIVGKAMGDTFGDLFEAIEREARLIKWSLTETSHRRGMHFTNLMAENMEEQILRYRDATSDLEAMVALISVTYIALFAAHARGFTRFREGWNRVHAANMTKIRASGDADPLSMRKSKFDIVKPPGWMAPTLTDLLNK